MPDTSKRKEKEIDKMVSESKTVCCNSGWHRRGRADFRCDKCNADVTMDILYLYDCLSK